ncbi:hypothetical protein E2C01_067667 [Portunus trituberculatus]|uniref:Uncharacterized protein n=1 Tax=Portunus trituberculatus TaxID=210409 RepID=A0A5B7HT96_PORTR|nr:hypothetical protein [Portunus trituberculatus]
MEASVNEERGGVMALSSSRAYVRYTLPSV